MNAIAKFAPTTFTPFTLSEESKAWLKAWLPATRYCHYFALSTPDNKFPMGDWDAPFFDLDELNKFAQAIKAKYPDIEVGVIEGNLHINCLDMQPRNSYWDRWQKQHQGRLAYIAERKALHKTKNQERKEKMLERLKFDSIYEGSCFYFSVFQEGKEVYPYGLDQIPYFSYEEAEKVMQRYELFYPENDYYIVYGSLCTDYMLRADGNTDEAEQRWIDQHKARLQGLALKEPT